MPARDLRYLLCASLASERGVRVDSAPGRAPTVLLHQRVAVVRTARHFRCSVCGRSHHSESAAKACMVQCAVQRLSAEGVREWVVGLSTRYSCPHCGKIYTQKLDAVRCMSRCRSHIMTLLPVDVLLALQNFERMKERAELDAQSKRSALVQQTKSKPVLAESKEQKTVLPVIVLDDVEPPDEFADLPTLATVMADDLFSCAEDQSCLDVSASDDFVADDSATDDSATDDSVNVAPEPKLYRKEGQTKAFFRDGASYVCTVCRSKFFTKKEAEECFYDHPIEGEV